MTPRLSVVIPWSNRPELSRTLAHNRDELMRVEAEVIVACCGGDRELLSDCLRGIDGLPLRVVNVETGFNKALALNLGASRARAETLFFLDSDLELGVGSCMAALSQLDDQSAVTLERVVESSRSEGVQYPHLRSIRHIVELETGEGRLVRIETNRSCPAEGSRSAPGMVYVSKSHFIAVGGMNSDLTGWGWEDLDLLARLQLHLGLRIERAGSATHLSHGDDKRTIDGASRGSNEAMNHAMCMANYGLGHYFGTYEDDIATWASDSSSRQ